jgi:tetratricopeptide (TPR) repeat protein
MVVYLAAEIATALDHLHNDEAEAPFKQMLSLYSPEELRTASSRALSPTDELVLKTARRMELAFRKQGAHAEVLTALVAQIALANDPAARSRYAEVTAWLDGAGAPDEESPEGHARVLDDLEAIVRVMAAPFLVEDLARRYHAPRSARPRSFEAMRQMMTDAAEHSPWAYEIVRLFLRVSDPARAKKELVAVGAGNGPLAQKLDRVLANDATGNDWVELAKTITEGMQLHGSDDRDVALRVCRDGAARLPKALEPRVCVGALARALDQLVVAIRSFEVVRDLEPSRREVWDALAELYQARLFQMVTQENVDVSGLPAELARVEAFHTEAQKRFPSQPLKPGLAGAVFEVGRGYYNAGHINEAEQYLTRSIDLEPTAAALELLATVRLKRGDAHRAAVLLERAIHTDAGGPAEQLYRRAKLRRLLADAAEAADDPLTAEQTRHGAVKDWEALLGDPSLAKEFASEAWLERGKVLYQLGERDDALRSLARSIDALPDRGSTYADVIAFLVPRGELSEALDAYHRALGRSEVTDYLKVYCSLWVIDLAERAGQPQDPLALAYLRAADGGKWFDDLARWSTGRQSEAELVAHATTPARRAEASFYRGMKALRAGHADEAKQLWKDVLSTDMMAFFEFDMAGMYVKEPPPAQPRTVPKKAKITSQPVRPATPIGPSQTDPPPDGSI